LYSAAYVPTPSEILQTPLQYLKGVGPRRAADLKRVGLATIEDLLYRFPIRYEDRGRFRQIAELKPGESASRSSAPAYERRGGRASRSSKWSFAIRAARCAFHT
jgi:RecG-like helicase